MDTSSANMVCGTALCRHIVAAAALMVRVVNSIGPQVSFPVRTCQAFYYQYQLPPAHVCATLAQGILDYNGPNTLAVSLWAQGAEGAKLNSLALETTAMVESSMTAVVNQPMPGWTQRSAT